MNLFVAKLNPSTTTKDLQKLFAHYGLVTTVKIIFDHATGLSKCYGFIEMPNNYEAHEALNELNNALFQESILLVKESQPSDYRILMPGQGFRNRNNSSVPAANTEQPQKVRNAFSEVKTRGDDEGLRNFGYRGSGIRSFKRY